MRLILDTQVYLWFLADSRRLSAKARDFIAQAETVSVSAASIWEATIKSALGKLDVVPVELATAVKACGFDDLAVTALHAAGVAALPDHHRDPFDRLLVAQAVHESMHLLTVDRILRQYSELALVV